MNRSLAQLLRRGRVGCDDDEMAVLLWVEGNMLPFGLKPQQKCGREDISK